MGIDLSVAAVQTNIYNVVAPSRAVWVKCHSLHIGIVAESTYIHIGQ